jgi:hypothetical protein
MNMFAALCLNFVNKTVQFTLVELLPQAVYDAVVVNPSVLLKPCDQRFERVGSRRRLEIPLTLPIFPAES